MKGHIIGMVSTVLDKSSSGSRRKGRRDTVKPRVKMCRNRVQAHRLVDSDFSWRKGGGFFSSSSSVLEVMLSYGIG